MGIGEVRGRIYCVTNVVNGKRYVGKTIRTINKRWSVHLTAARDGVVSPFYRAIRKYGAESFVLEEICETQESELDNAERAWIARLKTISPLGYNLRSGGDGGVHHPETKAKVSRKMQDHWAVAEFRAKRIRSQKQSWEDPKRREAFRRVETRENMSRAGKTRWANPEYRALIVEAQRKARRSEEDRSQKSEIQKRKWQDPEYRSSQLKAIKGKKPLPDDFKERMSAAMKVWWANRKGEGHRTRG